MPDIARVKIKPSHLYIECCSTCQLKCARCPATEMGYISNVGKGYLKFEDLSRLIDKNPSIKRVELDSLGEIFLNPYLLQILKCAFDKHIEISCNTGVNLNTASREQLEGLVKYRFYALTCSIDGIDQQAYQQYRRGGDFEKVIENIKVINYFKSKYKSVFPILTWQFIVFGHNELQLPAGLKMARELNMTFYPKLSWDSEYSPINDREFVKKATGWRYLSRKELEENTGKCYERAVCFWLWYSPRVNWDGRVLGCCWNVWSEFGGNVFTDGYLASVNSERITYARKMLLGRGAPRQDVPCAECKIYLAMRERRNYLAPREILAFLAFRSPFMYSLYRRFSSPYLKKIGKIFRIFQPD